MPNDGPVVIEETERQAAKGETAEATAPVDLSTGEWHDPEDDVSHVVATAKDGFLCHISVRKKWNMEPEAVYKVLTNPDNSKIFRDIYSVPYRKVLEDNGSGRQVLEIEQASGFKFLIVPILFRTRLIVEQDDRNLTMSFRLAKRGTMKEFRGSWELRPTYEEGSCGDRVTGTIATMEQDVLPSFIPPFCGGILRGICMNACRRIVEDMDEVVERVRAGEVLDAVLERGIKGVPRRAVVYKKDSVAGKREGGEAKGVTSFPVAVGEACTSEEGSPRAA